ncbi:MAG: type II toxin-antitoxin system HicA family toxin [Methylococcaceae bacterium]|jgi:predicted RNA binding protein YcfA (HicA-like mRNA interferase family)|nr:type II toxin-antitoxin system HicA family toxin [Methylococcaceae bacterium]
MKLPRNCSGLELANKLAEFGYEVSRQTGSHIRLTTQQNGEHHILPFHNMIP